MSSKMYAPVPPPREMSISPGKPNMNHTTHELRQQGSKHYLDKTNIALILIAFTCLVSCIIIVYRANGRIVGGRVQPTVLLALFSAMFSFCIKLVFSSGVAIVWWRAFEEDNASLRDLHYIWKRGIGGNIGDVGRALSCGKARLVLAVFTVITIVDFSDGPLLQRSIRTGLFSHTTQSESVWQITANITEGWVGSIDQTSPATLTGSQQLDWTLQTWHSNRSIASTKHCEGICDGSVVAAGIDVNCSSFTLDQDLTDPKSVDVNLFDVSFQRSVDWEGNPVLEMTHVSMNGVDERCKGTFGSTICTVRTAEVEYDIHQDGRFLMLAYDSGYPRPFSALPSSGDLPGPDGTPAGALAALEYFAFYYLQSNSTLTLSSDGNFAYEPTGPLAMQFRDYASEMDSDQPCAFLYKNATDSLLWSLHEIMFRMALLSSTGNETAQHPSWTQKVEALTYKAEFLALWIAAGTMLLSILAVSSLFYGYWRLKRPVSLSPLETGQALAAVITSEPTGDVDMDIEQLLDAMGDKKMR